MKTVKVCDLSGPALDWAVAECLMRSEGYRERGLMVHRIEHGQPMPAFSSDWAQGGPIIEQVGIAIAKTKAIKSWHWVSGLKLPSKNPFYGDTALIAAMRCYVASKLGDVVEVPEELL